ncbi:DUF3786 domain-containing protein [Chloroflexota bacterium]
MTREHLKLPEQNVREYAHGLAYKLACEQLAGIGDIEQQCQRSGTQYIASEKAVIINHLNQPYRISLPDGGVSFMTGDEDVPIRDKILLLHYFTKAKGTPLSGKFITYKELPDGINYFSVFAKRAIHPIVNYFGNEPELLLKTSEILGGHKADYGDVAVTINGFSRVPLTIVLWQGDEEFASEGSIMFDSTISDYLTNDDIHTLCENTAWRLVRRLKTGGDNPGKR